jgi:hypothetical protein
MTLLTERDAFYTEHRPCGELEAGVEGPLVWFDCECGRADRPSCWRRRRT